MTDLDLTRARPGHHDLRRHRRPSTSPAAWSKRPWTPGLTLIDTANGYAGGASEKMLGRRCLRRSPRRGRARHQGRHAAPGRRRATRRCRPRGLRCQRRGKPAPARHRPRRPLLPAPAGPRRPRSTRRSDTVARAGRGGQGRRARRLQLRRVADRRGRPPRPTRSAHRARSSPSSSTTSSRVGSRTSTSSSPPTTGLATMVYNPLGGGLLTGRHPSAIAPRGPFRRLTAGGDVQGPLLERRDVRGHRAPSPRWPEAGIPVTELALRWLVSKPTADRSCSGAPKSATCGATSPPSPPARSMTISSPRVTTSAPPCTAPCRATTARKRHDRK